MATYYNTQSMLITFIVIIMYYTIIVHESISLAQAIVACELCFSLCYLHIYRILIFISM